MDVLNKFTNAIKSPEELLSAQLHLVDDLKHITKNLYDVGKSTEVEQKRIKSALSKLIIKNFDEEQIWQQIELQNKPSFSQLTKVVSKIVKNLPAKVQDELPKFTEENNNEVKQAQKPIKIIPQKSKVKPPLGSSSIVDDKFFKLSELELFLNEQDEKETNKVNKSSDEEDSIDYFDDLASDDEENRKLGHEAKYEDFFDKPRDEMDDDDIILDNKNDDKFDSNEDLLDDINTGSDEDSEGEQLDDNEEYDTRDVDDEELQDTKENSAMKVASNNENETDKMPKYEPEENHLKSTFQKRQEKLKEKIKTLEEQQLAEKPWQLKGEVTAAVRPENCLLEEHVKFDHVSRPAPVITEETTIKLEDIIKGRIKDKSWDDVERKIKPPEHPFEYRRQIALDQEKSKMSLAEVYEQEYLKKQKSEKEDNETELPEHTEVKKLMSALFTKLDALSNFRFKPKPPQRDIKVVSNLPALTIEEVAPVSVSDAALLAPEEIKAKVKGTVKGKTERDITDRKRERRKKKLAQKMKWKKKEKAMSQHSKLGLDKKSKQDALKKLKKKRNITIVKESENVDSAVKSSKAFFSALQDQNDVSMPTRIKMKKRKS